MLKVIRNADIGTHSTCFLFSPFVLAGISTLKFSSMLQGLNPMAYLHLEGIKKPHGSGCVPPPSEQIRATKVREYFDKKEQVDIFPCSVTVV